ncbi:MAG: paraquat-inducible protein A [Bacteroidota bacterium]
MPNRFFYFFSLAFLIGSTFLSWNVIQEGKAYQQEKEAYTQALNYRNRFLDPAEWTAKEETAQKLEAAEQTQAVLQVLKKRTFRQALYLGGLLMCYIGLTLFFYFKSKTYSVLVLGFIIAALACLPVGLMAPMLEIGAFERNLDLGDIPISAKVLGVNVNVQVAQSFPGDMYFYYQSKSVVELISLLFQQKNWVVGGSILLFSILFPISKILLTLLMVFIPRITDRKWVKYIVEKSGKWSMADVFVVAVFLAFLAFSNMQVGITTDSKVLVGLYFFLGYCLLSLMSSVWVGKLSIDAGGN